jgi:hypothetical protein
LVYRTKPFFYFTKFGNRILEQKSIFAYKTIFESMLPMGWHEGITKPVKTGLVLQATCFGQIKFKN